MIDLRERNKEIVRLRMEEQWSTQKIGDFHNVTQSCIQGILRSVLGDYLGLVRGPDLNLIERNKEIVRLKLDEHWTLQKIGDKYGITRERVRQILVQLANEAYATHIKNLIPHNKQIRKLLG